MNKQTRAAAAAVTNYRSCRQHTAVSTALQIIVAAAAAVAAAVAAVVAAAVAAAAEALFSPRNAHLSRSL